MSCAEEDEKELELKDLIVQTLESNGLLAKIKAQLRASVFLALDENDKNYTKNENYSNIKVKKLLLTNEGREAVSLVRDFLEVCNLDFTISVFDPELNSNILMDKKDRLIKNLNIDDIGPKNEDPILVELLRKYKQNTLNAYKKDELPSDVVDILRAKFYKLDLNKKGSLDKEKAIILFVNLFSVFNKNMIERFVTEEFDNTEYRSGISLDDTIRIYHKFYQMCNSVSSHYNLTSKISISSEQQNDKFGFITSRNTALKSNILEMVKESIDDSTSSKSSITSNNMVFKRNDNKPSNDSMSFNSTIKQNLLADSKKKTSNADVDDSNDIEILKPTKMNSSQKSSNLFDNDELFRNVAAASNKASRSSVSELPPLTGNFQNNFFSTAASKEIDTKFDDNDDNYNDDFTNGTTPRTLKFERKSSKNRSAIGSDEEIEDNISYVEDNSKFDEVTIDRSISTIQGNNEADYIEDVSI